MARVTVEDAIKTITNRFELTLVAAYRARQLTMGSTPLVDPLHHKPVVIALREISAGKVGVEILHRSEP